MGDFYAEKLVKKKPGGKDFAIKALLIVLTVLAVLAVFLFPFALLLVLMMAAIDVMVFRSLDLEYEYQYINGDFDVDKIMHKERRKNLYSANIKDLEILEPAGRGAAKSAGRVYDFTSGTGEHAVYEMIFSREGVRECILFEPDESMVEGIWMQAPRKVIKK